MTVSIHRVVASLVRSELAGVTPHTLAVAVSRLERDALQLEEATERQIAIELLARIGYPENVNEFRAYLGHPQPLSGASLNPAEITELHAPHYMRWVPAFLDDSDTQKNARLMLRWLVAHRRDPIAAAQDSLDNLRHLANESTTWRSSGYIVYGLGCCGRADDYEQVIRHAELVIEHDREQLELVAEGLYRLYPPALINALQFFLERTNFNTSAKKKEFATGLVLLAKVAEIDDRAFWKTYYKEMDDLTRRLADWASSNSAVERILDQIEKQMVLVSLEDEPES